MKPPKYLSIVITSIQIMQMFVGIVISLFTSYVIRKFLQRFKIILNLCKVVFL